MRDCEVSSVTSIASMWIGDRLSEMEIASIYSFCRFGHPFTIYSYKPIENLPGGVINADASDIFPGDRILRYWRCGSPAIHADLFRYAMLEKTENIWVDLDVIALRPFRFEGPWVMGYENERGLNNAVLSLPKNSPMLKNLVEMASRSRGIPPHLTGLRRLKYRARGMFTGGVPVTRWPWASTGPRAVTLFAERSGEVLQALPIDAFYRIPHDEAWRFVTPGALSSKDFPGTSWGAHLWGGEVRRILRQKFQGKVPPDSFLGRYIAMARSWAPECFL